MKDKGQATRRRFSTLTIAVIIVTSTALVAPGNAQYPNAGGNGDVFSSNSIGLPGEPQIDRYGRDAQCGGTSREYYNEMYHTQGVVMSIEQMGEYDRNGEIIRCGDCSKSGRGMVICWLYSGSSSAPQDQGSSPPPQAPSTPQVPATSCPDLVPAAEAVAASIEAGQFDTGAWGNLQQSTVACPAPFPRPTECRAMMADAQSHVRADLGYARTKAGQALACYQKRSGTKYASSGRGKRCQTAVVRSYETNIRRAQDKIQELRSELSNKAFAFGVAIVLPEEGIPFLLTCLAKLRDLAELSDIRNLYDQYQYNRNTYLPQLWAKFYDQCPTEYRQFQNSRTVQGFLQREKQLKKAGRAPLSCPRRR